MSRKVNESQKKEILELFKKGINIKEISKIYNFTIPTITRQLKNLIGANEFSKIKNSIIKNNYFKDKREINIKEKTESNINLSKQNSLEDIKPNSEINSSKSLNYNETFPQDSLFVELTPIEYEIENSKQKDFSSVSITEIEFPKVVYMIVDQKIELEIKLLKEYPEWQFLSQEDLNRKTIKIYLDMKSARRDCTKDKKVIKVPNTNVFKIVSPILLSRGISRIVSCDQLIAL